MASDMHRRRRHIENPIRAFSIAEVAELHGFHPNTVRLWISRDGLRSYRKGPGGKVYIREDDLKDFLLKNYEL